MSGWLRIGDAGWLRPGIGAVAARSPSFSFRPWLSLLHENHSPMPLRKRNTSTPTLPQRLRQYARVSWRIPPTWKSTTMSMAAPMRRPLWLLRQPYVCFGSFIVSLFVAARRQR